MGLLSMRNAPSASLVLGIMEFSSLANILASMQLGSLRNKVDLEIHLVRGVTIFTDHLLGCEKFLTPDIESDPVSQFRLIHQTE